VSDGTILRTHILRPTWHFVHRDDLRWLLALSAPRLHQGNAGMYRRTGLDAAEGAKSNRVLAGAVAGGAHNSASHPGDAQSRRTLISLQLSSTASTILGSSRSGGPSSSQMVTAEVM